MVEICGSSVDDVEANVRMSSACRKPPAYMLLTEAPIERDCSCRNRVSMTSMNSAGDKMDPCHTPCHAPVEGARKHVAPGKLSFDHQCTSFVGCTMF